MERFAVARTRQGLAFRAHFGAESAKHHKGSCLGMTATWIRLHQAASGSSPVDRLNTVGSFEGMAHAQFYQHTYGADRKALLADPRKKREATKNPTSLEVSAQQTSSQAWGMDVQAMTKRTMDLKKTAIALSDFSGYGMLTIRTRAGNHVGAIHREPGSDKLSFFDPDLGEFQFPAHEAKAFFKAFSELRVQKNAPVIGFELMDVKLQEPIENTPLASLAGTLADR